MKEYLYKLWSRFLTQFSKIKILSFNFIPILAYDSVEFKITGEDILQIMEILKPGDVLVRGYDKYLDGKFIPDANGYSHAGIYIGDNTMIHAVSPTVQKVNIIDFCECDRVIVLRPKSGIKNALKKAESLIGVPYDFNYESDIGKLYCFELISQCYPKANMETFEIKKFFGLVKRNCYLAKSIYENKFFKKLFEKNENA